ncbi:MAG: cell division protein FtsW [Bacteroidia bacterium]|jgi:cell division protein FtsW
MSRAQSLIAPGPDAAMAFMGLALLLIGLIAISSASIGYAELNYGNAWFHTQRHGIYLVGAVTIAIGMYHVPLKFWQESGWMWLLLALAGLILVLIPGIGREVNGSQRWLALGPITVQPSEFAKLAMVVYLAGYMVRREEEMRLRWQGFLKPMGVLGATTLLLLVEPDFGATVIVVVTAMGMLFLAGVRLGHFLIVALGAAGGGLVLIVSEPYRLKRLTAFQNPWAEPFDGGYQLTQSLIAFGRGEWLGVGLGNSIQKLFYLPEAHTDFVFSIWAEEMGFAGSMAVILLFAALVGRILWAGRRALEAGSPFGAHVCFGVALIFSGQAFVNIGVSCGLLPTKGLTLPFISYGGSSLIVCCAMLALVLRVDNDTRQSGNRRRRG